jgi:hypothetical protein
MPLFRQLRRSRSSLVSVVILSPQPTCVADAGLAVPARTISAAIATAPDTIVVGPTWERSLAEIIGIYRSGRS